MKLLAFLLVLVPLAGAAGPIPAASSDVGPVPEALRAARKLDPFYQKHTSVAGFPILGSSKVSDAALREAAWILRRMLEGRDDVFAALTANDVHLAVMAYTEYTSDVPEHRDLKPRVYWDRRARGLGGSPVSCAEENLLGFPNDPYSTENILIHEFAHIVHGSALKTLDPTFDTRLEKAYDEALAAGLWKGTYAATDRAEYWAEAVQSWFDDNRQDDSLHNHVNTRAELREYDPALAALCEEVLGNREWKYVKPARRAPADRAHLVGFDFEDLPRFEWREEPIPPRPRVSIQTELGNIEVELDYVRATRACGTSTAPSRWPARAPTPPGMTSSSASATSRRSISAARATPTARALPPSAASWRTWNSCAGSRPSPPRGRRLPPLCASNGRSG